METVSTQTRDKHFREILTRPGNNACADCGARSTEWVSIDFGIVICYKCSGAHRSLGPNITRVRSSKLDSWLKEQILILECTGNEVANHFFQATITYDQKLRPDAPQSKVQQFVRDKYVKRLWAKGERDPVSVYKSAREQGIIQPITVEYYLEGPKKEFPRKEKAEKHQFFEAKKPQPDPRRKQEQQVDLFQIKDQIKNKNGETAKQFQRFFTQKPKLSPAEDFMGLFKTEGSTAVSPLVSVRSQPKISKQSDAFDLLGKQSKKEAPVSKATDFTELFAMSPTSTSTAGTSQSHSIGPSTTAKAPDFSDLFAMGSTSPVTVPQPVTAPQPQLNLSNLGKYDTIYTGPAPMRFGVGASNPYLVQMQQMQQMQQLQQVEAQHMRQLQAIQQVQMPGKGLSPGPVDIYSLYK